MLDFEIEVVNEIFKRDYILDFSFPKHPLSSGLYFIGSNRLVFNSIDTKIMPDIDILKEKLSDILLSMEFDHIVNRKTRSDQLQARLKTVEECNTIKCHIETFFLHKYFFFNY